MITILGGELICALGTGEARLDALRNAAPVITTQGVNVAGERDFYPYYRLDDASRVSDSAIVDGYLEQVTSALMAKLDLPSIAPERIGVFLGSSSIDYSRISH